MSMNFPPAMPMFPPQAPMQFPPVGGPQPGAAPFGQPNPMTPPDMAAFGPAQPPMAMPPQQPPMMMSPMGGPQFGKGRKLNKLA